MARNKLSLHFDGIEDIAKKLDEMGGKKLEKAAENALKATHAVVTPKVKRAVQKSNLPRKGKYSRGASEGAVITESKVEWSGLQAKIDAGFNLNKSITPIFLIHGTRMRKKRGRTTAVRGLKTALTGNRKEIQAVQEAEFKKIL